ncbi:MAG TPA: hypothetical protein PLI09_08715 [Candidatus Hydrogenedentes bacterium]|nr:hypothetical protein [Candidatus Hydrogenedentota bacterium]
MLTGRIHYKTSGQIMGLAVVACFAYSALLFMQQQVFFKTAVETDATVMKPGGALFGGGQFTGVNYVLNNGAPVSARVKAHFPHTEGQNIRIAYNPKHPSEARLTEPYDVYFGAITFSILGVALLIADIVRRMLNRGFSIPPPVRRTNITRTLRVDYKDPITGERRIAHSEGELPPEVRSKLERTRAQAAAEGIQTKRRQTFTFTDASGNKRTYHSLDEMPPELRRRVEHEMHTRGKGV